MRDEIPAFPSIASFEPQLLADAFATEEADVLGERMRVFKRRARSLRDLLLGARAHADATYAVFADADRETRLTYREHERLVARFAAMLRDRYGVAKGDRVAIFGANRAEWIVAFWATVSLGAIAVGMNGWWTGAEARFALGDAEPKVLVADAKRLARLASERDVGVPVIAMEDLAFASSPEADLPTTPIDEDDPAIVLYTSGTTGRPKGAVHSHRNVVAYVGVNAFHGARSFLASPPQPLADGSPPPPTCALVTSPLFHVSGLHSGAITCLAAGVKTVWPMGRFDAERTLRLIARERVTGWGFTATLLERLTSAVLAGGNAHDVTSIRHLGGGGSPIAPALQRRAREAFPNARATLGVGYGLTECGALATLNPGDELRRFPTSVGRPLPTIDVAIRDAQGDGRRALGEGEEGEICVRSPLVMLGYWRRPEETRAVLGEGRWLRTGDIGCMKDGRLYLTTRRHDLILRGGENVYPAEIEQRLEEHADVAEAAVVGVPHAELGEEVKAVVVPRGGAALDASSLAAWVGSALAYFKVPAHWEIRRDPLPRNATGKVMKHALGGATQAFVGEDA